MASLPRRILSPPLHWFLQEFVWSHLGLTPKSSPLGFASAHYIPASWLSFCHTLLFLVFLCWLWLWFCLCLQCFSPILACVAFGVPSGLRPDVPSSEILSSITFPSCPIYFLYINDDDLQLPCFPCLLSTASFMSMLHEKEVLWNIYKSQGYL